METVFCLVGPTATGKSALALKLADFFPIEIVSMDSAMVYQGLDIGTAKPSLLERKKVVHHLIDILSPSEVFSVGDFFRKVKEILSDIISRKKLPLITGGSLMYFNVLKNGMSELPEHNQTFRLWFQQRKNAVGLKALYDQLKRIDEQYSIKISVNDQKRIERGLELYYLTGQKPSILLTKRHFLPFQWVNFYLLDQMENLRFKIKERLERMLSDGLVAEVDGLLKAGVPKNSVALQNIGYRQVIPYLQGEITEEEMRQQLFYATSRLAKHQLTWLKKWEHEDYQLNVADQNLLAKIKIKIEQRL